MRHFCRLLIFASVIYSRSTNVMKEYQIISSAPLGAHASVCNWQFVILLRFAEIASCAHMPPNTNTLIDPCRGIPTLTPSSASAKDSQLAKRTTECSRKLWDPTPNSRRYITATRASSDTKVRVKMGELFVEFQFTMQSRLFDWNQIIMLTCRGAV